MDCYFHHAVPSVAKCSSCGKSVCATCRAQDGGCPTCRFAAKIDAAAGASKTLPGGVGPSSGASGAGTDDDWSRFRQPPPGYGAGAGAGAGMQWQPQPQYGGRSATLANVKPESRALVALGYPFWPLALIAVFDRSKSDFVRRNAWQALGFNAAAYGIGALLSMIASIPLIGLSAWPLLPFVVPVTIVLSVVYGFKVWHGEDVNVPFVSDIVDERLRPTT
jgi:uncharacterized membrane protein